MTTIVFTSLSLPVPQRAISGLEWRVPQILILSTINVLKRRSLSHGPNGYIYMDPLNGITDWLADSRKLRSAHEVESFTDGFWLTGLMSSRSCFVDAFYCVSQLVQCLRLSRELFEVAPEPWSFAVSPSLYPRCCITQCAKVATFVAAVASRRLIMPCLYLVFVRWFHIAAQF